MDYDIHNRGIIRKPAFCVCINKGAADQRLCFRLVDSTIPLLHVSKSDISSLMLLWLYSPVCIGPGQKAKSQGFSCRVLHSGEYLSLSNIHVIPILFTQASK